jgi:hypothetical protein
MLDLRTHCNYPILSYKRFGHASLHEGWKADQERTDSQAQVGHAGAIKFSSLIDVMYYAPTV